MAPPKTSLIEKLNAAARSTPNTQEPPELNQDEEAAESEGGVEEEESSEEEQSDEQGEEAEEEHDESEKELLKDDSEEEEEEEEKEEHPKLSSETGKKPIVVEPKGTLTKPFIQSPTTEANQEEQLLEDDTHEEEEEEEDDDDPISSSSQTGKKPIPVEPPKSTLFKHVIQSCPSTEADQGEQVAEVDTEDEEEDDVDPKPSSSQAVTKPSAKRRVEAAEMASERKNKKKQKKSSVEAAEKGFERKREKSTFSGCGDGDHEEEMRLKEMENNSAFKRKWPLEDEILIMERVAKSIKKGIDPFKDRNKFFESIEKSLHVNDVSCVKLFDKLRKLRKKYINHLERAKGCGGDPLLSNPHDARLYAIMDEIWGPHKQPREDMVDSAAAVASGKRARNSRGAILISQLKEATLSNNMNRLLERNILKEALGMVEKRKAKDLEDKWDDIWKKFHVEELKLSLEHNRLVREYTVEILDALNSSDS